jgi:hypothetical protein
MIQKSAKIIAMKNPGASSGVWTKSSNQIVLLPDSIEEYVGDDNAVRVTGAYINGLDLSGMTPLCL